jgi:SAM-dependent methyltransferase
MLTRMVYKAVRPYLARLLPAADIILNPYISGKLIPLQATKAYSIITHRGSPAVRVSNGTLPVPPKELWEGYGDTEEEYLSCGHQDMASMLDNLRVVGESPQALLRVLDLGCAAGRMLRFYPYIEGQSEIWGVDIKAKHICWCQQHLNPPLLFATTTTMPHLPFEDNYFDLVYCGSVFTHISDLADAWFLELRRILRKGGYAYITIHDKHTIELLLTKYKDRKDYHFLIDVIRRLDQETSVLSQDFAYFSIGSEPKTQVFYDVKYLVQKWSQLAKVVSVTPEAHSYQTALLFRK